MIFGMKCCDYTCNGCGHKWTDTKQRGYESMAYEISGCVECKSKDCSWEPHISEEVLIIPAPNFANLPKPPNEFVDQVLSKIKKHHSGYKNNKSSINLDW